MFNFSFTQKGTDYTEPARIKMGLGRQVSVHNSNAKFNRRLLNSAGDTRNTLRRTDIVFLLGVHFQHFVQITDGLV